MKKVFNTAFARFMVCGFLFLFGLSAGTNAQTVASDVTAYEVPSDLPSIVGELVSQSSITSVTTDQAVQALGILISQIDAETALNDNPFDVSELEMKAFVANLLMVKTQQEALDSAIYSTYEEAIIVNSAVEREDIDEAFVFVLNSI